MTVTICRKLQSVCLLTTVYPIPFVVELTH
uniref:Uncharacterized protein n=1 Tax=Anguilla anguilla TaxID=7936 RepID=A0A0E9S5F3_ANGAN